MHTWSTGLFQHFHCSFLLVHPALCQPTGHWQIPLCHKILMCQPNTKSTNTEWLCYTSIRENIVQIMKEKASHLQAFDQNNEIQTSLSTLIIAMPIFPCQPMHPPKHLNPPGYILHSTKAVLIDRSHNRQAQDRKNHSSRSAMYRSICLMRSFTSSVSHNGNSRIMARYLAELEIP